jgi:hypothetical protein
MSQAGKRLLFDADSVRWLADHELQLYPAPVRPAALWLLGGVLVLMLAVLVLVSVLISRIG